MVTERIRSHYFFMNQTEFEVGAIRPVECVRESWEIIKPDYWLLFAVTLVGVLIAGVSMYVLLGAMVCGIFYCYLRRIDGEAVKFEWLFKGFEWWLPGLLVGIVLVVPMVLVYLILYLPLVMSLMMGPKLSEGELLGLLGGAFAVDLVVIVLMVCFHTLLMFAFPLIVDRGLGPLAAMKLSARAVWANLKGVAGLYGVGFALSLAGTLVFCVGTYFVIPIIFAGNVLAYRKIFPARRADEFPPSPASFQGAGGAI